MEKPKFNQEVERVIPQPDGGAIQIKGSPVRGWVNLGLRELATPAVIGTGIGDLLHRNGLGTTLSIAGGLGAAGVELASSVMPENKRLTQIRIGLEAVAGLDLTDRTLTTAPNLVPVNLMPTVEAKRTAVTIANGMKDFGNNTFANISTGLGVNTLGIGIREWVDYKPRLLGKLLKKK